jgi:hypothetical protein
MPKTKGQNSKFKAQNLASRLAECRFGASGFFFVYLSLGFDLAFGFWILSLSGRGQRQA